MGLSVVIQLGTEVYMGHVVKKTKFDAKERDATEFAFKVAEICQVSATEAAIMLARLDMAGLEIRPKADGM